MPNDSTKKEVIKASKSKAIDRKMDAKSLRQIAKLNKTPKGEKNILNTEGYILEVRNVDKRYVSGHFATHVLKNVNFGIKKGEIVYIVGASGSGKTTLLNIISGLDRATTGDIIFNNCNISALTSTKLTSFRRDNVGFIFQSYNLLPELSSQDNVIIAQNLQRDVQKRIDIDELFKDLGMEGLQKNNVRNLSGGQQQRVSIARALSKGPTILFADEPTGALDSENAKKVTTLFKEVCKKYGITVVIVSHDLEQAKIADQVIHVKDGRISIQ